MGEGDEEAVRLRALLVESIVRSLAETEPVSEVASQVGCALCNADLESRGGLERHEENCPYRRAVEWVSSQ